MWSSTSKILWAIELHHVPMDLNLWCKSEIWKWTFLSLQIYIETWRGMTGEKNHPTPKEKGIMCRLAVLRKICPCSLLPHLQARSSQPPKCMTSIPHENACGETRGKKTSMRTKRRACHVSQDKGKKNKITGEKTKKRKGKYEKKEKEHIASSASRASSQS